MKLIQKLRCAGDFGREIMPGRLQPGLLLCLGTEKKFP